MIVAAKNKTILLVDDDPIAINIASRTLKTENHDITLNAAFDGIAAYRYIQGAGEYADRTAYPLPDLILLDLQMPRFTGFEFLRWLRENAPEESRNTPVIILSASSSGAEIEYARALRATYFLKPARWPALLQAIKSAALLEQS